VVIRHDHIDSRLAQPRHRGKRGRAAIAGDDYLRTCTNRGIDSRITKVVPILETARDKRNRFAAEISNRARQERRRANTVDVIVPVYENELLVPYCPR
jgi:hypothetical protein